MSSSNSSICLSSHNGCVNGLLLPAWHDVNDGSSLARAYRAVFYLAALAYMMYGANVVTDRLVSTIEVVTSMKRRVSVKLQDGSIKHVKVPIWHPVVATLTVYVIGASAPEVFLPVIEVIKHKFHSDGLGPSLIVGSGAFHLFFITGICIASVKGTTAKPIQDMPVFFVSTAFAIIAYLWLYLLAEQFSPGVIELWEALVTLAFFPCIVFACWAVERRLYFRIIKWFKRKILPGIPNIEDSPGSIDESHGALMVENERRRRLGKLLKELKLAHPSKSNFELEELAELKLLESVPKGASYYRMQAAKASSGGGDVISKEKVKKRLHHEQEESQAIHQPPADPYAQVIGFEEAHYTCIESCGSVILYVERLGAGVQWTTLLINYQTFEGTAKIVEDYEETHGTLEMLPGVTSAQISVVIIDDDEFEEDKEFYVRLSEPRILAATAYNHEVKLVNLKFLTSEATVLILDDDHCGSFHFEHSDIVIPDNTGTAVIKVVRSTGARGDVLVPFKIHSGTALPNDDYFHSNDMTLFFENNQSERNLSVDIVDKNRIGEMQNFSIELLEPIIQSQPPANPEGNPVLGSPAITKIGICEDVELTEALDRLLKVADMADLISSTTWADQFREAVQLSLTARPNMLDEESQNYNSTNCTKPCTTVRFYLINIKTIVIYVISLPWKLLAAALPPAHLFSGWLAFICLLTFMAFNAAIIGDLATHFGCTVGLRDTVTAVTLITFGMGLPDMFASRHAAMHENTADAAIGHITGSNAVNVFLGIGLAWTVAAGYKTYNGKQYKVPPGSFGFTVTLYCCFATVGVLMLLIRRFLPPIRGELGGPRLAKIVSSLLFISLWLVFITLSTLRSYCIITPGI